jgi:hypothetical protein
VSGMSASRSSTAPAVKDGPTAASDARACDAAADAALDGWLELLDADEPHATRARPATAVTAMVRNRFTKSSSILQLISEWSRIPDGVYLR